jgi:archaellum component FlaF (FlaF/FlaG flagellin family)
MGLKTKNHCKSICIFTTLMIIAASISACGSEKISIENSNNLSIASIHDNKPNAVTNKDISGDGKDDKIDLDLLNNANLILKINEREVILSSSIDREALENEPRIHVLNNGILMVTVERKTNKIGSSVQLWLYDYKNDILNEVIKINDGRLLVDYTLIDDQDGLTQLSMPNIGFNQKVRIDSEFNGAYEKNGTLEFGVPISYNIKDYNNDGVDELVTKRRISVGAIEWFPYINVFTFYKIEGVNLKPIKYLLIEGDEIEHSVVDCIISQGCLDFNNYLQTNTEFEEKAVKDKLNDMVSQKVLLKNTSTYVFNLD